MTAVKPSRKSSLAISTFAFLSKLLSSAYFFKVEVKPRRKPVRCVPPSMVLMLLTKRVDVFVISIVISHCDFNWNALTLGVEVDDIVDERFLIRVDVFNKFAKTIFRVESLSVGFAILVDIALYLSSAR